MYIIERVPAASSMTTQERRTYLGNRNVLDSAQDILTERENEAHFSANVAVAAS